VKERCAVVLTEVVTYRVDESTVVGFEIEPVEGFHPAGVGGEIAINVRDAVGPAVEAAKVVLDRVKEACPDQIEVKFGVKVSGGANWLIAKAATEGSFEITLSWSPGGGRSTGAPRTPEESSTAGATSGA
jgi:hypothetical protein